MTNYGANYLSRQTLEAMPFKALGENVLIHERTTLVGIENLSVGSHVRIDPDVVILATGDVRIGNYVHIATGVFMAGRAGIEVGDYCSIAHGSRLYTTNDDYSGDYLVGPTIPAEFVNITAKPIRLEPCVQIGASAIILPGVTMKEGSVLGVLSLLAESTEPWMIYGGVKAKVIRPRKQGAREMARILSARTPSTRNRAGQS